MNEWPKPATPAAPVGHLPTAAETTLHRLGAGLRQRFGQLDVGQGDHPTRRYDLPERGRLWVGRGPGCDVRVPDPLVSRVHALLDLDRGLATATDLASANGTWLGGVRLPRFVPRPWRPGQPLRVGAHRLWLDVSGHAGDGGIPEPSIAGRRAAAPPAPSLPRVAVLDLLTRASWSVPFTTPRLRGGRWPGSELVLDAPTVSWAHIVLDRIDGPLGTDGGAVFLSVLSAGEPVWLDARRVTPFDGPTLWHRTAQALQVNRFRLTCHWPEDVPVATSRAAFST
jgi:hypothetical protein